MADQASLNSLLKWGITNSSNSATSDDTTSTDSSTLPPRGPASSLNQEALAQLFGAPSDAERMKSAMAAIIAPLSAVSHDQKLIAWENFQQLVEQIDNANNVAALNLWDPLLAQLGNSDAGMRQMAAWSVSTTVQNNVKAQEKLLGLGGIEKLCEMVLADSDVAARKKAVGALSSEVRNYQPAADELVKLVPANVWVSKAAGGGVDAADMEAVDELMAALRSNASSV